MNDIHGVCFVLIRDARVLLEKCPRKREVLGVGEWFVPGGKIEGDELVTHALVREMQEELGVAPKTYAPLPIIEGSPIPPTDKGLFLMRPFVVREWYGALPFWTLDQHTQLRWIGIGEALVSPVPQVRAMVAMAAQCFLDQEVAR